MTQIDVRGLSCPIPLMHTKKAIESSPSEIVVLADSGTAKANVVGLLTDMQYDVEVTDADGYYTITGKRA